MSHTLYQLKVYTSSHLSSPNPSCLQAPRKLQEQMFSPVATHSLFEPLYNVLLILSFPLGFISVFATVSSWAEAGLAIAAICFLLQISGPQQGLCPNWSVIDSAAGKVSLSLRTAYSVPSSLLPDPASNDSYHSLPDTLFTKWNRKLMHKFMNAHTELEQTCTLCDMGINIDTKVITSCSWCHWLCVCFLMWPHYLERAGIYSPHYPVHTRSMFWSWGMGWQTFNENIFKIFIYFNRVLLYVFY